MNSHKPQLLVIVAALITLLITTGCVNVQPVAAESPAGPGECRTRRSVGAPG